MIPFLTSLLEKLGLVCPLPGTPTRYLVPSILPTLQRPRSMIKYKCELRLELTDSADPDSAVRFIPESLWARLLVKCAQYDLMLNEIGRAHV